MIPEPEKELKRNMSAPRRNLREKRGAGQTVDIVQFATRHTPDRIEGLFDDEVGGCLRGSVASGLVVLEQGS